jgi:hypothetical protein
MREQDSQMDSTKLADGLVVLAQHAARSHYPNAARVGCPSREILLEMARRQARGDISRKLPVTHVAFCTPCFLEFEKERHRLRRWRLFRFSSAVAAALAASLMIAQWIWPHKSPERSSPKVPAEKQLAAVKTLPVSLVVDLAEYAIFRGDGEVPKQIVLQAKATNLTLLLPVGAEPGSYSLRINQGSKEFLRLDRTSAQFVNQVVTITASVDLREAKPGAMQMQLQRDGSSPRTYEVVILD